MSPSSRVASHVAIAAALVCAGAWPAPVAAHGGAAGPFGSPGGGATPPTGAGQRADIDTDVATDGASALPPLECGTDARVHERFADGAAWEFCWGTRERDGPVLGRARWTPPGGAAPYPVLASARLAQLHVAYDDGDVTYNDITQFGLGGTWMQPLTEADCPGGTLLDERDRRVACLYRDADGPGRRGADGAVRAGERLTLFTVSQVGAYTYIVTWRFHADGTLEPSVGASGALQRAGDDVSLPFGRVLANDPGTLWLSHTHNYHWRLDLDLGADPGDDAFVASVHERRADGSRARTSRALAREEAFASSPDELQAWHVLDAPAPPSADPLAGRGYALEGHGDGHAYERTAVEPWSGADLHVSVARDCERHASENALFFPECGDDVGAFVDGEPLGGTGAGADLVVWKRVSFHHVPRNEDRVRMHTHWDGFRLRPFGIGGAVGDVPGDTIGTSDPPVTETTPPAASDDRPGTTGNESSGAARDDPASPDADDARSSGGGALGGLLLLLGGMLWRRTAGRPARTGRAPGARVPRPMGRSRGDSTALR